VTGHTNGPSGYNIRFRDVMAVFVGNGLEFYDFLVFSYFAVYISRTFYPNDNPTAALLATLATFGAGFLTRPIGAVVIGGMGDRIGRKPAMIVSFTLMGIAIAGLALTPSYAAIGVAAPLLVLGFRLLQGFALGGEVGPSTAFMAEAAPVHRRGLYLSMQFVSQDSAVLIAGSIGAALAVLLTEQQLQDWGWRAAMLIGVTIVPFGLWLRRTLPETLHRTDGAAMTADATTGVLSLRAQLAPHWPIIMLGLAMLAGSTVGSYTANYMTTYALTTLELATTVSFGFTLVTGVVLIVFDALGGWLSDQYGRKPVMVIAGTLLVLAILPCFWAIARFGSIWVLYGAQALMVMLFALSTVPVIVTITESLPKSIRSGAVAVVYAVAISVFGGSTQFVITWLLSVTDNRLAPAYLWLGAAVIGLAAMLLIKESSPARASRRAQV